MNETQAFQTQHLITLENVSKNKDRGNNLSIQGQRDNWKANQVYDTPLTFISVLGLLLRNLDGRVGRWKGGWKHIFVNDSDVE